MISKTAEYALRLIVNLAEANEETVSSQALAEQAQVPEDYAIQILCQLRRRRIVIGQRGRHGGYRLRKSINELTLLEIVEVAQPIEQLTRCPLGYHNENDELCPVHRCIADSIEFLRDQLAKTTIQEVVDTRRERGLCGQHTDPQDVSVSARKRSRMQRTKR